MTSVDSSTPRRPWRACLLAAGLIAVAIWLGSAVAADKRAPAELPHGAEGHNREAAALRKVMDGPVDIFFDPAQMAADKPGIAGARFVDLVDVTGKELLRFDRQGKEQWLVDPDAVAAFRISKAK